MTCAAPGCDRTDLTGRGLCNAHYCRARNTGTLEDYPIVHRDRVQLDRCRKGHIRTGEVNCSECRREHGEAWRRRVRQQALDAYGHQCACCGEGTVEFLVIDHVGGGGNEHRRAIKSGGSSSFYAWLKRNGYPDGFQTLCHNCNMAKSLYGTCPHQVAVPEEAFA